MTTLEKFIRSTPSKKQGWDSLSCVVISYFFLSLTQLKIVISVELSYLAGLFLPESIQILHI